MAKLASILVIRKFFGSLSLTVHIRHTIVKSISATWHSMLHTRAHRSPQRVKRLDHIAQFGAHLHQPGDGLTLAADAVV